MKVYEVTDSAGTNHAGNMSNAQMVQKARTVKAKIDKAEATGDADLLFSTGADLGELLMNNLYPKMLKFTDIMLIRMEKEARKNPDNPGWQQFMKELGPLKAKLAQQKKQLVKQGVPLGRQDVGEVARVWSRTGGKQTRKYRCTHGHRKGRVMSSPAACNAPINVKKSVGLSTLKSKRGKTMANQSKITRRTNPASMRLPRLNKPKKTPFGRKKFK